MKNTTKMFLIGMLSTIPISGLPAGNWFLSRAIKDFLGQARRDRSPQPEAPEIPTKKAVNSTKKHVHFSPAAPTIIDTPAPKDTKSPARDEPVAPSAIKERPLKEAKPSREVTVGLSAANPIEKLELLSQPNGWECGWYSVFHYLATKNGYPAKTLKKGYQTFVKNLIKDEDAAELYEAKDYLDGTHLESLLERSGGDINEVLIVDEQYFSGPIPTQTDIVERINEFRARGETFWVLICTLRPAHWVCLMFPEEGGCIGIDSLAGNREPNQQNILVRIKNLCLGIVPLPEVDQFHVTLRRLKDNVNIPASPQKQATLEEIRTEALENGFTEETFGALSAHITKVYQDRPGRKKKVAAPIVIEDNEEEEEEPKPAKKPAPKKKQPPTKRKKR